MYTPRAFAETDLAALDRLAAYDNFATLVGTDGGRPQVTHLPLLYSRTGDRVELRGHFARANPQSRHAGRALAILHGPHAYVSPSWYPDEAAQARVPTWNYAVAHLEGELELLHDEADLAAIVAALSERHEGDVGGHWRFERERTAHRAQLGGIVGFRLVPGRIELAFKLSQNHPRANRESVAAALAAQPRDASRAVAALMHERIDRPRVED